MLTIEPPDPSARILATAGLVMRIVAPAILARVEPAWLTLMFCDLAGSTALAERLDLEEMREIIRAYQDAVSKEIARLSGIPQEPQEAAICLGCHATASETEDWEKDDTFHREDGVQCEMCHGPGSEYMDESVMMHLQAGGNRSEAARALHVYRRLLYQKMEEYELE